MIALLQDIWKYRELVWVLAWKNVIVRYKQAYMGLALAVLKPVLMMLIFTLVKAFIGIDSGDIPYPILTFAALMPWILFQEAASTGVLSVTSNAALIRKIYFPREILPLTTLVTKLVELVISFMILAALMIIYKMAPTVHVLWMPLIIIYALLCSLVISLAGAALNVYYRDVANLLPVALMLLMYASPVIYPLSLVQRKLLIEQAAGEWSNQLYTVYLLNPLAGIIDSFQRVMLKGLPPDFNVILPGLLMVAILLPLSYQIFKRAEGYFADVI